MRHPFTIDLHIYSDRSDSPMGTLSRCVVINDDTDPLYAAKEMRDQEFSDGVHVTRTDRRLYIGGVHLTPQPTNG